MLPGLLESRWCSTGRICQEVKCNIRPDTVPYTNLPFRNNIPNCMALQTLPNIPFESFENNLRILRKNNWVPIDSRVTKNIQLHPVLEDPQNKRPEVL